MSNLRRAEIGNLRGSRPFGCLWPNNRQRSRHTLSLASRLYGAKRGVDSKVEQAPIRRGRGTWELSPVRCDRRLPGVEASTLVPV